MEVQGQKYCAFCGLAITDGQKWVRSKIPGSEPPCSLYFHNEPFPGQIDSCFVRELKDEDRPQGGDS